MVQDKREAKAVKQHVFCEFAIQKVGQSWLEIIHGNMYDPITKYTKSWDL